MGKKGGLATGKLGSYYKPSQVDQKTMNIVERISDTFQNLT